MTFEDAKRFLKKPNDPYHQDMGALRFFVAELLLRVEALESAKPEHKPVKGKKS